MLCTSFLKMICFKRLLLYLFTTLDTGHIAELLILYAMDPLYLDTLDLLLRATGKEIINLKQLTVCYPGCLWCIIFPPFPVPFGPFFCLQTNFSHLLSGNYSSKHHFMIKLKRKKVASFSESL